MNNNRVANARNGSPGKPPRSARYYRVHGMGCAEEVGVLKRELAPLVGGEHNLSFDLLRGRMTISAEASGVSEEAIIRAVARTGMKAELWREGKQVPRRASFWEQAATKFPWRRNSFTCWESLPAAGTWRPRRGSPRGVCGRT